MWGHTRSPERVRITISWKTNKQASKIWLFAPVSTGVLLLNVGGDQLLGKKGNPDYVRALCRDKLLIESKWTAEKKRYNTVRNVRSWLLRINDFKNRGDSSKSLKSQASSFNEVRACAYEGQVSTDSELWLGLSGYLCRWILWSASKLLEIQRCIGHTTYICVLDWEQWHTVMSLLRLRLMNAKGFF